jgi:hypothetical protein
MKKIYIAGKITGLDNYKELFNKAETHLSNLGFAIMNPSVLKDGFEWNEYMHVCYAMIDVCDSVYFLSNWTDSKGARLEHEYAKDKGKRLFYENEM